MNPCKTKYPILLAHGTGSRDDARRGCWGRIPGALEEAGATVFYGNQDAWGTIEANAKTLKESTIAALSESKSEKINIISLSKGGLESRYMISKLDMAQNIASLTTISTPHYGSKTMDFLCGKQKLIMKFVGIFINYIYRKRGDKNPNFYNVCRQFTTAHSEHFNREILDDSRVYYQSYASVMSKFYSDMLLFAPYAIVKMFDGDCDGVVSVDSAKWGEFRGVIEGKGTRGISHSDLRDLRRRGPAGKNVADVYVGIVSELKGMGF